MKAKYDALVIGTGFGGAVTACRLAQANLDVGVLERGRRYPMGTFPRDFDNMNAGWLYGIGQGLFDIKPFNEMTVVQGAGYGGGSLIYANVQVRPPASVFESGWPAGYSLNELAPYYDLVGYMLDITPISARGAAIPVKTTAMRTAAHALNRDAQFFLPNIAVDLGPQGVHKNKFQVDQQGCNYCGECDIGCNIHAKNTLDLNYLKKAEDKGADITTRCEVRKIETVGKGYRVTFFDHQADREGFTDADRVFLCAGAVNSTELLLRCRDEFQTLRDLSGYLGHQYSGNGDFLAFAFNSKATFEPSSGPTITAAVVFDREVGNERVWFLLEDGGYPKEIANLIQLLNPKDGFLKSVEHLRLFKDLWREVSSAFPVGRKPHPFDQTAVMLAMGRDRANGTIKLLPTREAWIDWDVPSNLPLYDMEAQLCTDFAKKLGGDVAFNPFWKILHVPVSVHNLGGCPMSSQRGLGVTDDCGEVWEYPGLYVFDGAILPGATGVNPSHTIAAVVERNVEHAIRKITNNPNWEAPQKAKKPRPIDDPISKVFIPKGGTALPVTPSIQLSFTETMRGFVGNGFAPPDYQRGYDAGRIAGTSAEFTITIKTVNLDEFLINPRHQAVAAGSIRISGITDPSGSPIRRGIFNLFVTERGGGFYQRKMLYHLPFIGQNGKSYVLDGFKDVRDHGSFDVWGSTATLYTEVREPGGPVVATGIVRISLPGFLHQLATFRVTGTNNPLVKGWKVARYYRLFLGTLVDLFIRSKLPGA